MLHEKKKVRGGEREKKKKKECAVSGKKKEKVTHQPVGQTKGREHALSPVSIIALYYFARALFGTFFCSAVQCVKSVTGWWEKNHGKKKVSHHHQSAQPKMQDNKLGVLG